MSSKRIRAQTEHSRKFAPGRPLPKAPSRPLPSSSASNRLGDKSDLFRARTLSSADVERVDRRNSQSVEKKRDSIDVISTLMAPQRYSLLQSHTTPTKPDVTIDTSETITTPHSTTGAMISPTNSVSYAYGPPQSVESGTRSYRGRSHQSQLSTASNVSNASFDQLFPTLRKSKTELTPTTTRADVIPPLFRTITAPAIGMKRPSRNAVTPQPRPSKTRHTPIIPVTPPQPTTYQEISEEPFEVDKTFWPYYRLVSDIAHCNPEQLLTAIDTVFGFDSLRATLSQFVIEKLKDSLGLDDCSEIIYAPPRELMFDNHNQSFQKLRSSIPNFVHPQTCSEHTPRANTLLSLQMHTASDTNFPDTDATASQRRVQFSQAVLQDATNGVLSPVSDVYSSQHFMMSPPATPWQPPKQNGTSVGRPTSAQFSDLLSVTTVASAILNCLDQRSLSRMHLLCRRCLYACRLPNSRSHLHLKITALKKLLPAVQPAIFLQNRLKMFGNVQFLHIVMDKPKWDVIKILLPKLPMLRQLDLMLPALTPTYVMPSKVISKHVKLKQLKSIRISGPTKLMTRGYTYPDASFILRDLWKRCDIPNLKELWLVRVTSLETGVVNEFLNHHKSTLEILEFDLELNRKCSFPILSEVYEYAQYLRSGVCRIRSLAIRFFADALNEVENKAKQLLDDMEEEEHEFGTLKRVSSIRETGGIRFPSMGALFSTDGLGVNALEDIISQHSPQNSPQGSKRNSAVPRSDKDNDSPYNIANVTSLKTSQTKEASDVEYKLRTIAAKIVNELCSKVKLERLIFPGFIGKVHWEALNRLQTLRNLHVSVYPVHIKKDLATMCQYVGTTLTNIKLIVDIHGDPRSFTAGHTIIDIQNSPIDYLYEAMKELTHVRHMKIQIGLDNEVGCKVSIDSVTKLIYDHCTSIVTIDVQCSRVTYDPATVKTSATEKHGVNNRFFIPDVATELIARLEGVFYSCNMLKRVRLVNSLDSSKNVILSKINGSIKTEGNLEPFLDANLF